MATVLTAGGHLLFYLSGASPWAVPSDGDGLMAEYPFSYIVLSNQAVNLKMVMLLITGRDPASEDFDEDGA
jgi:hypothetical protein